MDAGAVLGLVEATDDGAATSDLLAGGELCQAAFRGQLEYLRLLLMFGAPVDACDYDRRGLRRSLRV